LQYQACLPLIALSPPSPSLTPTSQSTRPTQRRLPTPPPSLLSCHSHSCLQGRSAPHRWPDNWIGFQDSPVPLVGLFLSRLPHPLPHGFYHTVLGRCQAFLPIRCPIPKNPPPPTSVLPHSSLGLTWFALTLQPSLSSAPDFLSFSLASFSIGFSAMSGRDRERDRRAAAAAQRTNEYFVPGVGIDREVITADICRYLGNDALVRPGTYEVCWCGSNRARR